MAESLFYLRPLLNVVLSGFVLNFNCQNYIVRIPHSYRILNGTPTPFLAYKMSPPGHTRVLAAVGPVKSAQCLRKRSGFGSTITKSAIGRVEREVLAGVTNFGLKLLKHVHVVAPPELPNETCFVVRVTQKMDAGQSVERGWVV